MPATTANGNGRHHSPYRPNTTSIPDSISYSISTSAALTKVDVTVEQKTEITQIIKEEKVDPVGVDVDLSVGVIVPQTVKVKLKQLPPRIVEIVPGYEGYLFFVLADGRIVIVEPSTLNRCYFGLGRLEGGCAPEVARRPAMPLRPFLKRAPVDVHSILNAQSPAAGTLLASSASQGSTRQAWDRETGGVDLGPGLAGSPAYHNVGHCVKESPGT